MAVFFSVAQGVLRNCGSISGWDNSLLLAQGRYSVVNGVQITVENGTAVMAFYDGVRILNAGLIAGAQTGIDMVDTTWASLVEQGTISSVNGEAVILNVGSTLSSSRRIVS